MLSESDTSRRFEPSWADAKLTERERFGTNLIKSLLRGGKKLIAERNLQPTAAGDYSITVAVTNKPGFYQNSWIAEFFGIPIYVTEETKISAKKTKNAGWATVIWNESKLKMYLAEKVRKPPA